MGERGRRSKPATGSSSVQKRRRSNASQEAERWGKVFGPAPGGRQLQGGNGGAVMHHRLSTGKVLRRVPALREKRFGRCFGIDREGMLRHPGSRTSGSGSPGGGGRERRKRSEPWLARVAKHPEPSRGANRRGGEKPRGRNKRQAWQRAAEGAAIPNGRAARKRHPNGSSPGVDARR
jgi:hypothetical protein